MVVGKQIFYKKMLNKKKVGTQIPEQLLLSHKLRARTSCHELVKTCAVQLAKESWALVLVKLLKKKKRGVGGGGYYAMQSKPNIVPAKKWIFKTFEE